MPKTRRNKLKIVPNDTPPDGDKRAFCRFMLKGVPVRFKDLKTGARGEGNCHDISGGGAGVECAQDVRPRTPLEMWFDLQDGFEPLHFLGRVAWAKEAGPMRRFGIAFDRQRLMSMSRILKMQA